MTIKKSKKPIKKARKKVTASTANKRRGKSSPSPREQFYFYWRQTDIRKNLYLGDLTTADALTHCQHGDTLIATDINGKIIDSRIVLISPVSL